jgi:hypothetical protein
MVGELLMPSPRLGSIARKKSRYDAADDWFKENVSGPIVNAGSWFHDEVADPINKGIEYYAGPHASQSLGNAAAAADMASYWAPGVGDAKDTVESNFRLMEDIKSGAGWPQITMDAINYGLAVMPMVASTAGLAKMGRIADAGNNARAAGAVADAGKAKKKVSAIAKLGDAKNLKQVPDLRNLKTSDAVKIAQKEPHLIESGNRSEGLYIGGPRNVKSRRDLLRIRRDFDAMVERDPRGADWYDRTRGGISEVTGNNPNQNDWMSAQHGQFSAGVDPSSELGFAIKDNNANLMGMPTKAARPAQMKGSLGAISRNDWRGHQLGKKTGQYTSKINPNLAKDSAVGTNDFRHARNLGYTDAQNVPVTNAHGEAQHTFMDYETAHAVGRANKKKLGGRADWNGEKLQAAPWVVQKGDDIHGRRPSLNREQAFLEANKTIADYFPKHEAYATYEQVPGAMTGHMPDAITASEVDRMAYSADPRGAWDTAPGKRDAIYAGLQRDETGVAGRVRASRPMQGMYTPPGGGTEFNPGMVARPLVGVKTGKVKSIDDASRAMLESGELVRAYVDAQAAGAAHKPFFGGQRGMSNSLGAIASGPRTPDQMKAMAGIGAKYNLPDIVDTGEGFTATRFYPEPDAINSRKMGQLQDEMRVVNPDMTEAMPVRVDGVYAGLEDEWKAGVGSGAATDKLIKQLSQTPEIFSAFDNNPYVAQKALGNLQRDAEWAAKFGATRADIQNARRIIAGNGDPKGWLTRLMTARQSGAILPGLAGALMYSVMSDDGEQ